MAFSPTLVFARSSHRRALKRYREDRATLDPGWQVDVWQNTNIMLATLLNPFRVMLQEHETASSHSVAANYHEALHELEPNLDPSLELAYAHYEKHTKSGGGEPLNHAAKEFRNAGYALYRRGLFSEALKAFLNTLHLDALATTRSTAPPGKARAHKGENLRNVGYCLVELGDLKAAALYFAKAALEHVELGANPLEAAACYELAGLAWEAMTPVKGQRPSAKVDALSFDSTLCFQKAKTLFNTTGDYDAASRCFILERDSQARWSSSVMRKGSLRAMRIAWLYGESPTSAFLLIIYWWLAFAAAFFFAGFKTDTNTINYGVATLFEHPMSAVVQDFGTSLYFSAVTMSTLGYGDYQPASNISRLLSGLEAFLGVILVAMFIVAVQRRYVGR